MRAFPAVSLEYFSETAAGKTALPAGAGVLFDATDVDGRVVAAEAEAEAVCELVDAHSAWRKAAQLAPLSAPACCAA